MISTIQRKIIIRSLLIRRNNGENINEILETYKNLTDDEKNDILTDILSNE